MEWEFLQKDWAAVIWKNEATGLTIFVIRVLVTGTHAGRERELSLTTLNTIPIQRVYYYLIIF